MTILYPDTLYLLFLLIPVLLVLIFLFRKSVRDLEILTGKNVLQLFGTVYTVKWFFRGIFFLFALAMSIFSLAGISWGETTIEEDREGLEILFTVDISRSMLAQDVGPSRLQRAGEVIRGVVNGVPGSRFGAVIFKGAPSKIIPITEDQVLIESFLDYLSSGMISTPGSDIGAGLELSLKSFPEGSDRNRIIILFTDGERVTSDNSAGNVLRTAYRAGQLGIPVYTVACGTEAGSVITLSDGSVLLNEDGSKVISRMNTGLLQEIAGNSSGEFFLLSDPDIFSRLIRSLEEHNKEKIKEGFRVVNIERYRFFLLFALLFLVLRMVIRSFRWGEGL
ncbi:MAG: VWA domain-containing protein [Spirochaetia bacterium]